MLDNETKRRIDTARDILVGKLPDPKSQVEQITIALIYKFMDDMDTEAEEFGGKKSFFIGEYEKYAWHKLFDPKLGGFEILSLYSEAIIKLNLNPNLPQLFRDIFKNAYLPYRDPETLKLFLKTINEFKYDHSERLGDAFEYLLSVLGSQGDAGQFRTPRHIIDFIVEVVAPQKNETICDPACGTAGFLISSYKHILQTNTRHSKGDKLTPAERTNLMTNFVGYDISPDMVRLSLVNLYLHNFPAPRIFEYDTLTSEERWNEYFDVIMANPPFMSPKGGIKPHKKFSIAANRSEVLFVDYIAEHINPTTGRAGVIVPEGIIFQSGTAYKSLRKMLVDKNYLYAVVSLPAGVFNPYSGVKTSVLLMDRQLAAKTDKILFVKIQSDGFGLGAQRRETKENDLPAALELINNFKAQIINDTGSADTGSAGILPASVSNSSTRGQDARAPGNFVLVPKAQIAANGDYNLSGDRYRTNETQQHKFETVRLGDICVTSSGGTPLKNRPEYFTNGTIPWIKSGEVAQGYVYQSEEFITEEGLNNSSAKLFPKDTVLVAMYGATAGQVGLLKFEATTNQAVCGILPNGKVLPEYLYLVLKSRKDYLIQLSSGGAQPNISQTIIKDLKIPLPPLEVQREIVEKIEGFQRIIDGAKQVVENYKPQIDISPDWETVELGEVGELKNGINYTKESNGVFVQVLGVKDFKNNFYAPLDSFATIQIDGTLNGEYSLKENDIVFVRSNGNPDLIGRNVVIPKLDFKATFSGFTIRLRITSPKVFPLFYAHLLKTDSVRKMLTDSGTGANIKSLNQTSLKELTLPLPPLEVQQEIVARIEREQSLVDANKELINIFERRIKDEINKLWT